ncbi:hypothetical protein [Ornithinibacillus sp. 179-J 7C1 HS]|uniref:hypothetical protein n=1 Tax=Ornithinibacillus sp. 179-J 7C1 HS TaxID=3142384 RepID=UPI00399F377C
MLEGEFTNLINEFGVDVYLNLETETRKVIVTSLTKTPDLYDFDDKKIHTDFPIKRGDTIKIDDTLFIVFSDVQLKRGYEYQSIIRPATNVIPIVIQEEVMEIVDVDPLGRPIYEVVSPEIREDFPCIVFQDKISIDGSQIRVTQQEIQVVMGDNEYTQAIVQNDEFTFFDNYYRVIGVDMFQKGLRIFQMERTAAPA